MSFEEAPAINALVTLYGLAVDTQRWDLFDEVFTEDVHADYGAPAVWTDLKTFKRDFAVYHDPFDGTMHTMTNVSFTVKGDVGSVITYGHWLLKRNNVDGGNTWQGQGWYDDEIVRQSNGWRIKRRVCRIVNWSGNCLVNQTIPDVDFAMSTSSMRAHADAGTLGLLKMRGKR